MVVEILFQEVCGLRYVSGIVLRIAVASHDVHVLIAGIPVFIVQLRSPHPQQIVDASFAEIVEHIYVEFLIGLSVLRSPPKPAS